MTSINRTTNPTYVPPSGTTGTNNTNGTKPTAPEEGLFSPPAENTPSPEEIAKANKKQSLEAELASYQAKRQALESQLKEYTNYQNQLREKKEELKAKEENLQKEIEKMETEQKQTQLDLEKLKNEYDKNNAKLLELIQKMNEKIQETADKSSKAVEDRQKKIESAQKEAFKMVQEGKLTEDQVMDYIANKSGNPGIIKTMMESGVQVAESMTSQIKGLIAQMSGSINSMNTKKLKIESLNLDIMSKKDEKEIVTSQIARTDVEIQTAGSYISRTQTKIDVVDVDINNVQNEITALEDDTLPEQPTAARVSDDNNTDPQPLPRVHFGGFTVNLSEMMNPVKGNKSSEKSDGSNPFMGITSTIDYSGLKTLLDTVMEQNNTSLNKLKDMITANNRVLDQKPQAA